VRYRCQVVSAVSDKEGSYSHRSGEKMPEAARLREQAEKALRPALPTSDNLTSARLIKPAKRIHFASEALEKSEKR
jgi:hypothetical protein